MIEQLKNLLAEIPSGVYSLLATLIPLFGAVLLHNQKVKALQEIAEKNIEMFKEVPSTSKAHAIFEEIITRDAEKIRGKEEGPKLNSYRSGVLDSCLFSGCLCCISRKSWRLEHSWFGSYVVCSGCFRAFRLGRSFAGPRLDGEERRQPKVVGSLSPDAAGKL